MNEHKFQAICLKWMGFFTRVMYTTPLKSLIKFEEFRWKYLHVYNAHRQRKSNSPIYVYNSHTQYIYIFLIANHFVDHKTWNTASLNSFLQWSCSFTYLTPIVYGCQGPCNPFINGLSLCKQETQSYTSKQHNDSLHNT